MGSVLMAFIASLAAAVAQTQVTININTAAPTGPVPSNVSAGYLPYYRDCRIILMHRGNYSETYLQAIHFFTTKYSLLELFSLHTLPRQNPLLTYSILLLIRCSTTLTTAQPRYKQTRVGSLVMQASFSGSANIPQSYFFSHLTISEQLAAGCSFLSPYC